MKLSTPLVASLGVLLVGASALVAPPASAAADTTPPTLSLPGNASFQVGATLTDADYQDGYFYSEAIPMRVSWSASDDTRICEYDVVQEWAGLDPTPLVSGQLTTSFAGATGANYDGTFGGGSLIRHGWNVVARDCAGNETQGFTSTRSHIYTENGVNEQEWTIPVTTTGTWSNSSCACWLGDAIKKTTAPNASISFQVTNTGAGHRAAIVTNTGPDRGSFDIFVDGVRKLTYNSYATAATKKNSVIAWESAVPAGTHTIKIVNKATAGHPRVDVDALIVN